MEGYPTRILSTPLELLRSIPGEYLSSYTTISTQESPKTGRFHRLGYRRYFGRTQFCWTSQCELETSPDTCIFKPRERVAASMLCITSECCKNHRKFDESEVRQRYRIDAITIFAVPAEGPHGFYTIGK